MCLTQVGFRVWCKRKLTLLLNRDIVLLKMFTFFLPHVAFGTACSCILLYDWHVHVLLSNRENMFMAAWKQIPSTPFLPFRLHSGSPRCFLELQASGLSHLWHQALSTALHIQISCILCRGGLCYWGMHVKRHWRPLNSRLLIHCHIMDHLGQKEPEKMMHVLKFTTFPEMCRIDPGQWTTLIFSDKCLFNLDSLLSRNMWLSRFLCG